MAIIDFFDRGWDMDGKAIAYIQGDRTFTFDEVGDLSCRIANTLLSLGLVKETKGAVWSGNDVMAWACTLGLWRANMAWIPVNPRNAAEDNGFILDAFDCEVLFFQQAYSETIAALRPALPKVRHWVCIDADLPDAPSLEKWSAGQPATKPAVIAGLDDVFIIMPTGGTTGAPKGVMNTHRAAQTTFVHFMLTCTYRDGTPPVNLAAAPMTHTAGLLSLPCTAQGGAVVILPRPDPMLLVQAIGQHRVTEFFLPPTVIYALLEAPGIEKVDFSSLRYLLYGAAPMSVEKLKKAIALWGPVHDRMVMARARRWARHLPPCARMSTWWVGSLPSDGRARFGRSSQSAGAGGDHGRCRHRILPRGETGEICVRGDLIMKGYYKAPEKTVESIIDGWLHTGDIGHIDAEGYLHLTDRKKDMIITGGFNVYPSDGRTGDLEPSRPCRIVL
jgi:acyl-CoA synthetase (AMP-forming)/AMP-acid ligase II